MADFLDATIKLQLEFFELVSPEFARKYRELLRDMHRAVAESRLLNPSDTLAKRRMDKRTAKLDNRLEQLHEDLAKLQQAVAAATD